RIGKEAVRRHFNIRVMAMDAYPVESLIDESLVIFVCSTTGNGVEPRNMAGLWRALIRADLPSDLLDHMRFAVFGLGDSSYERFNWAAKKLQRRLISLGAVEILPRGDADDQDYYGISISPIDDIEAATRHLNGMTLSSQNEPRRFPVTMTRNDRTTPSNWFQDVRQIEFVSDEEISYEPGDVAVLYPETPKEDVEWLMHRMGWEALSTVPHSIEPRQNGWPLPQGFPRITTIEELLIKYLDISAVPRRSFFECIRHFASDEREKEKLEEFCSKEGQEDLHSYATRPRRTILEVLSEFRSVKIPLEYITDAFSTIRPRQFSIASAANVHPRKIQLCVAIVNYRTVLKAPRTGLCTRWLANMQGGTRLEVSLGKGTMNLPSDDSKPIVMIGPGTGVAPLRAFLEERILRIAKDNLLYFGCRSKAADCHYKGEWDAYVSRGELVCRVAASRDQEDKVYVQHLIREDSKLIYDKIVNRAGYVYVCGSSNQMPRSVKKAVVDCLVEQSGWDEERASEYVKEMELAGRWGEECWS
ncbi:NAPDH-dependent diflavin reductase, partial [Tulasnella sp. 403]